MKNENLSTSWLNGKYQVGIYEVTIITGLSFICFEADCEETYTFTGSWGDKVIKEINTIFNTYTNENDAPTIEESINKWINLNL